MITFRHCKVRFCEIGIQRPGPGGIGCDWWVCTSFPWHTAPQKEEGVYQGCHFPYFVSPWLDWAHTLPVMLCSCVCQRQEGCPNALCFPSGTHRLACSHPCSFGKQWAWPSPAPAGCGLVNCSAIPVGLLFPVDSRENSPLSYMNKNLIKKKKA